MELSRSLADLVGLQFYSKPPNLYDFLHFSCTWACPNSNFCCECPWLLLIWNRWFYKPLTSVFLRLLVSVMSLFFLWLKKLWVMVVVISIFSASFCVFQFWLRRFSSFFFNLKKNYVVVDVTSFINANLFTITPQHVFCLNIKLCYVSTSQRLQGL